MTSRLARRRNRRLTWTVRRRMVGFATLAVVFVMTVGGTALWALQQESAARLQQQTMSKAARQMLDARASADTVRSSVFETVADSESGIVGQELVAIGHELTAAGTQWQADLRAVGRAPLDQVTQAKLADSTTQVGTVLGEAQTAYQRALTSPLVAVGAALSFDKVFDDADGAMTEVQSRVEAALNQASSRAATDERLATIALLVTGGAAAVVLVVVALVVVRSVTRPLSRCVAGLERLAERDLTATFGEPGNDEIGRMVRALTEAVAAMKDALERTASRAQLVDHASHELGTVNEQLLATAQETAAQAAGVALSAGTVNESVESVAVAVGQLSTSMRDVAEEANAAATTAEDAAALARQAAEVLAQLEETSTKVDDMVAVIESVAAQTHLLALNATIEASRAGAAGRGFAVVASEVKELARTAQASTAEVTAVVAAMRHDVQRAAESVGGVVSTVGTIDATQAAIARAVEDQTRTAQDMRTQVGLASQAVAEITSNVAAVAAAAEQTTASLAVSANSASELTRNASELRSVVETFTV